MKSALRKNLNTVVASGLMAFFLFGTVSAKASSDLEQMRSAAVETRQNVINAANNGEANAQYLLGVSLYHNLTGEQDFKLARGWFAKAAEQGVPEAQNYLGKMNAMGLGGEKDHDAAIEWYELAASKGYTPAHTALGEYYLTGEEGLEQDYRKARNHFAVASDRGDTDAAVYLGLMHFEGKGVLQDYVKARDLLEKAANQGDSYAQYSMGAMLYDGLGVSQNLEAAQAWFNKACESGTERGCAASKDVDEKLKRHQNIPARRIKPN